MSRTDELRRSGGRERGGSGGAGFVKWGDDYTFLEGQVVGSFTTDYGLAVTIRVSKLHERGVDVKGKDEDGKSFTDHVSVGDEVNIGTQSASLNGKIMPDDVGKNLHVAFEGWSESKNGRKFRVFTVIELSEREPVAAGGGDNEPWPEDSRDHSDGDPDSDVPF